MGSLSSTLGLPQAMSVGTAKEMVRLASNVFELTIGPLSSLEHDLDRSSVFFDPVAQGARLRRALDAVTPVETTDRMPQEWLLPLPSGSHVLTPEGVAALHLLRDALSAEEGSVIVLRDHVDAVLDALLAQYRTWSRHRISSVIGLLEGKDKPLQAQAAGTLITLLINNNVGPERSLPRYGEANLNRRNLIDEAFFNAVNSFTRVIAPKSRTKSGGGSLISGWYLGEIARRFGKGFVSTPPHEDMPGHAYVERDAVPRAILLIARDISRGNRDIPSVATFALAVGELVDSFRNNRSALAGLGALYESPTTTRAIRAQLLEAYEREYLAARDLPA